MSPNQAVIAASIDQNLDRRYSKAMPNLNRLRCRSMLAS